MVPKRIALLLFYTLTAFPASAQPTLPDITGRAEKGTVVLSWNCQYGNVKAISVLRSADSTGDFTLIGYVEQTGKGVQTFTDTHPEPGRNCYKVAVGFKSGLTWRSNHYCLRVERSMMESDKQLAHTTEAAMPEKTGKETGKINVVVSNTVIERTNPVDNNPKPATPKIKLPAITNDTVAEAGTSIKSRFITRDENTGHVYMSLPNDISDHHYSVKFYDHQNHVIFEVPKINADKILFDKRNFQRKGTYKFIIRKDAVELEEGYIGIGN